MGRFSAPDDSHLSNDPYNQVQADAAEPMDWTMISDDENVVSNTDDHDDDVMMLARMQLNDNTIIAHENDDIGAAGDSTCTSRGTMIAYNNVLSSSPATAETIMENNDHHDHEDNVDRYYGAMTDNTTTNDNNISNAAMLQMTQHCLQLSNDYNHILQIQLAEKYELQRRTRRKRNKRIIIASIIMTALFIITVVLKLHAPPPPPVVMQNSIFNKNYYLMDDASLSSLVGESSPFSRSSSSSNDNANANANEPAITHHHHQTWGEYTFHTAQITSAAILYTASVFWYAIRNSFRYAALDVKDSIVGVMSDFRNVYYNRQFLPSSASTTVEYDGSNGNDNRMNRERAACPIRIQAAYNRHALLPRGVASYNNNNNNNNNNMDDEDPRIMEGFSTDTEESLRQHPLMLSLPSQNIALQMIAQGIDSWGESLVEDTTSSADVLHRMASFMTGMGSGTDSAAATSSSSSSSSSRSDVQDGVLFHNTDGEGIVSGKGTVKQEWILPPAKGFLFVGPAGVGKLYVAQHLADWFFAHCNGNSKSSSDQSCSSKENADNENMTTKPVLEIIAGDNVAEVERGDELSRRRSIIQHIHRRKGLGSVIIIHHIERLDDDDGLLSDIVKVLNGNANTISYAEINHDNDGEIDEEVSCDGTIFLLTTELWGTKRIFQMIQQNGGLNNLPREALLSGIRWEVNSHLQYWQRFNSHTTIVPFLPFQQDDLSLIVQRWFQELSNNHQGIRWARLDMSTSAIEFIVGADQVDYLDLYNDGHLHPTKARDGDESHQLLSKQVLTFSTNGAHALYQNALYIALKSKLQSSDTRRRPFNVAFLDVDQDTLDYYLSWCDPAHTVLNECETSSQHWRLPLSFS